MVEIDNPLDIINTLKQYQKLEDIYCNGIDMNKCNTDHCDDIIVFK